MPPCIVGAVKAGATYILLTKGEPSTLDSVWKTVGTHKKIKEDWRASLGCPRHSDSQE